MKALVFAAVAAISTAAMAAFVGIGNSLVAVEGKAVAMDVKSADAGAEVTASRVRNFKAWTNGEEVITTVYTNSTRYFDNSNGVWVATNIVISSSVTNEVRLLSVDRWITNEIVKVVCSEGFATSNIVGGAWFVPGDFIYADGATDGVKATLIFE